MSIAAMNWAMEQRTGAPSGQCVLYVLADVADPSGMCFPSIGYIAERSQQSRDTVRRRLREMEENGLLVRFERHEKTGRQKSAEIRLMMGDAAVSISEPDIVDSSDENTHENAKNAPKGEGSNLRGGEGSTRARGRVAMVPPHEPPLNQDSHPQSPFKGAVDIPDHGLEKRVLAVEAVYPSTTTKRAELKTLISALSDDEHKLLVLASAGYAVQISRQNQTRPKDAAKFAREKENWPGFAKLAPAPQPKKGFVERGTRAWAGLCVLNAVMFGSKHYLPQMAPAGSLQAEGRTGTLVSDRVDLAAMASLADFANETGRPDFADWSVCIEKSKQWWAWNDRAKRCGYGSLEADLHDTGETYEQTLMGGRVETFPKRISGVLVPSEWPPRLTDDGGGAGAYQAGVEETDDLEAEVTVDA